MTRISVIISTYNGAHKIHGLIQALAKQAFLDFEVIVVVDGSTDGTLDSLQKYAKELKNFRVISQPNLGRSKVRNRGAKEATGDLLIFFDDDMIPSPDSVKKHQEFHLNKNGSAILSGNQIENIESGKTDIQNYKARLTKKWTAKYAETISRLNVGNLFFTAANCSTPRKLFDQLGGFDEELTDAEDFDLALRAIERGIPVYFDKSNQAIHRDFITCKSYIKRLRQYAAARKLLAEKHPSNILIIRKPSTSVVKRFCYRICAMPFLIRLIDGNKFIFLPKFLRYKFYEVVIHSLSSEFTEVNL